MPSRPDPPTARRPLAPEAPLAASPPPATLRRIGLVSATALVVTSMVGTGVFTTTGFLAADVPSPMGILLCWAAGGVAALCGALAYAELSVALADNGGEYHYLSKLFHPGLGFLSAWASLIVGFSAPLAAIALAFDKYLAVFVPGAPPRASGAVLVLGLSLLHAWRVSAGTRFQNVMTFGKVALIALFIWLGIWQGDPSRLTGESPGEVLGVVATPAFAVGLLWVSFSYTGWNAAAYVAGEVKDPARVLPRALALGTGLVTLLYVGLNGVFLAAAPLPVLAGAREEVAHVAAVHLLGGGGGRMLSGIVTLGLISTVGALVVTGPRIYEAVGRDFPRLRWLALRRVDGGPVVAIGLQALIALAMLLSASFETLLSYIGLTLSLFAGVTVSGVFVLRRQPRRPGSYRMPGYPVTPLLFVALMAWVVVQGVLQRPVAAAASGVTIVLGWLAYTLSRS